ncbi:Hypothetical predicted protein [Octopus vulgaris]|uniref:Uncharacterized protein n=1 Tax=Octopus vulgaris TaxID=6645 RepID=A0AA36BD24_OCTVU|nr:Hypothetical predicted protein [Octopus vulgaris]
MGVLTVRRVGFGIFLVWLLTLLYLWFPAIKGTKRWPWISQKGLKSSKIKLSPNLTNAVHVILASDENTIGGMIATMNSIYSNTKHNVMFHLIVSEHSVDHVVVWLTKTKLQLTNYEVRPFRKEWVKDKIKVHSGRKELSNPKSSNNH